MFGGVVMMMNKTECGIEMLMGQRQISLEVINLYTLRQQTLRWFSGSGLGLLAWDITRLFWIVFSLVMRRVANGVVFRWCLRWRVWQGGQILLDIIRTLEGYWVRSSTVIKESTSFFQTLTGLARLIWMDGVYVFIGIDFSRRTDCVVTVEWMDALA